MKPRRLRVCGFRVCGFGMYHSCPGEMERFRPKAQARIMESMTGKVYVGLFQVGSYRYRSLIEGLYLIEAL